MTLSTPRRALALGASTLLLALLAVLVPGAPAQAHDRLIESDPESGATLEEAPSEITLTYSGEVERLGGSVELQDSEGRAMDVGTPKGEGTTVTTPISEDLAPGDYEVSWRIVSSDGHPISGTVDFTVEEGASPSSTTSTQTSSAPETSETSTSGEDAEASDETATEEESGTSWTLVLLGVAAVAVVLGAIVGFLRSRRRTDS